MIARCPGCEVRYKVAREKIGPRGSRMRCARCDLVFRIEAPEEAGRIALDPAAPRVLYAEADDARAKQVSEFLLERGLRCDGIADGDDALLSLLRNPPSVLLVGGYLHGLGPGALMEAVGLASDLREVEVARIASPEDAAISPGSGAVQLIDPADLPDGLLPLLEGLALGAPRAGRADRALSLESPGRAAGGPDAADPESAAAERLARIVISDIILYNEARFIAALKTPNPAEFLESELSEARALFEVRVSPALRARRDFLAEELERQSSRRRRSEAARS